MRISAARSLPNTKRKDITWLRDTGTEMTPYDWHQPLRAIGVYFGARPLLTMLFNAADIDVGFKLPEADKIEWTLALDTSLDGAPVANVSLERAAEYKLRTRSLAVFAGRSL